MSITVVSQPNDSKEAVVADKGDLAEQKKVEAGSDETKESASEENKLDEKNEDSETSEVEENENEGEELEEAEELEEKPKKKGGFKKRIDKLLSQKAAVEQEREYWRQEALKNQSPESKKQSVVETKEATGGKPNPDNFDSHAEYVEALSDWKVEQKFSARDAKQKEAALESEFQKKSESLKSKIKTFAESVDDFNEVVGSVDDIKMSDTVSDLIIESENGPELMYALAKNRDEYERICALPERAAAVAIGKFEAKLAKSSAPANENKETQITKAPKPISAVGAKSSGSAKKSINDPNLSQREYEQLRRAQIAKNASM